ncbi:MAG: hypothetical protein PHC70_04295 [Patescibacteria group bacterium]|nr:hypothetical protein [Patescibacteria group bacterium]
MRYTDQGCFFFKAVIADRADHPPKKQELLGAESETQERITEENVTEEETQWDS